VILKTFLRGHGNVLPEQWQNAPEKTGKGEFQITTKEFLSFPRLEKILKTSIGDHPG